MATAERAASKVVASGTVGAGGTTLSAGSGTSSWSVVSLAARLQMPPSPVPGPGGAVGRAASKVTAAAGMPWTGICRSFAAGSESAGHPTPTADS